MNVIICDDEPIYTQSIQNAISCWAVRNHAEQALNLLTFRSAEELLERIQSGLKADALFMDIQFRNEDNGIRITKRIHQQDPDLPVVLISNYGEYVYEGYTVNALRYLRKPVTQADIDECMDIIWHHWSLSQQDAILFETMSQTIRLPAGSILSFEAFGHNVQIKTTKPDEGYQIRMRLNEVSKLLPDKLFVQCHRSYIVNIQFVRRFTHHEVSLSNGDVIPIGRIFLPRFLDLFQRYYQGGGNR